MKKLIIKIIVATIICACFAGIAYTIADSSGFLFGIAGVIIGYTTGHLLLYVWVFSDLPKPKEDIKKLKFSKRRIAQAGPPCPAEWQVKTISDGIYYISCRKCGVELQSGCTPKCLNQ